MIDDDRQSALSRLLRATQAMLEAAEAGNWEIVEVLEMERKPDLEAYLPDTLEIGDAKHLSDAISELIVLNNRLIQCVKNERGCALERSRSLRQARSASSSYSTQ